MNNDEVFTSTIEELQSGYFNITNEHLNQSEINYYLEMTDLDLATHEFNCPNFKNRTLARIWFISNKQSFPQEMRNYHTEIKKTEIKKIEKLETKNNPMPKTEKVKHINKKEIELIKSKYGESCSTIHHSRLPIFSASRRPIERTQWVGENSWGIAEVTGRLGQNHRDLHDILMTDGLERKRGLEGELYLTIDPWKIMKRLMPSSKSSNLDYLYGLLEDMKRADVRIKYSGGGDSLGGIISNIDYEYKAISGPGGCVLERYLWRITINQTWMKLYDTSIKLRCRKATEIILQMRSGYSQSIARFFMTHTNDTSISLQKCLDGRGIEREAKLVKRDMKPDMEKLAILGITFEKDGNINYSKQDGYVSFEGQDPNIFNIGAKKLN